MPLERLFRRGHPGFLVIRIRLETAAERISGNTFQGFQIASVALVGFP